MKYKLAVFDMDGTILDTLDDLTASVNYAMEKNGFAPRTKDEVRSFIGDGVIELIMRACPEGASDKQIKKAFVDFVDYYFDHGTDLTKPYLGIVEAIKKLRAAGVKTGVVSNKLEIAVLPLAERFFASSFDYLAGDKEGVRRKPYPDSILNAITAMGATCEETVYIGDSDIDVLAGKNAGVDVLSVAWGYRSKECLLNSGAQKIVYTAEELVDAILID